jgi:hypothetical protein
MFIGFDNAVNEVHSYKFQNFKLGLYCLHLQYFHLSCWCPPASLERDGITHKIMTLRFHRQTSCVQTRDAAGRTDIRTFNKKLRTSYHLTGHVSQRSVAG